MSKLIGIACVLLAVVFEACGQLSLKCASSDTTKESHKKRWLASCISCYVVEAVFWTLALRNLDVSIAYPMNSLSFVGIVLMSRFVLKENVTAVRFAGAILIVCGTAIMGTA